MKTRVDLQQKLEDFLGSRNVYFQPPENIRLKFPCIIYSYIVPKTEYANNLIYYHKKIKDCKAV